MYNSSRTVDDNEKVSGLGQCVNYDKINITLQIFLNHDEGFAKTFRLTFLSRKALHMVRDSEELKMPQTNV